MTAIKNTSIIEGNLAADPQTFPKGQYVARVTFRILHNSRRLDQNTNKWVDGRATAVQVNFYGTAAERYIAMIEQQPGLFAKGTAVVAWGGPSDNPNAYTDREGKAKATQTLIGTRIIPDQIVNQRRQDAKRNANPAPAAQPQPSGNVDDDPWANDTFAPAHPEEPAF